MSYNLIPCDRDQMLLLPPSMKDWLPPDHPVWVVIDAVASMDLAPFYQNYREDGWGAAAFDPGMMVTLLLYGYSRGIRSSRKIAQACREDVAFRVITANHSPDHATIARFRQGNVTCLEDLFREVLRVCRKAGMIRLGVFSLDGTKLKANASLDGNRTAEQLKEEQKQLQDQEEQQRIRQEIAGQIEETLAEAERIDQEENARYGSRQRGDELPPELRDPATRQARLEECLRRLQEEAEEEATQQTQKIEDRKAEEEATGKKKRGRKPKDPDPDPSPQAKANPTDPDSRIMKSRHGYLQGYNGQVVVNEEQLILAASLTQEANDQHQLSPMLETLEENLRAIGLLGGPRVFLTDAGYCNEENLKKAAASGRGSRGTPELLIATKKDWKQRKECREMPPPRGRIPSDLTPRQRMDRKLRTERGKALYRQRGRTVEPVFGQIKRRLGYDGLLLRGLRNADGEWKLICAAFNLFKLCRWSTAQGPGRA